MRGRPAPGATICIHSADELKGQLDEAKALYDQACEELNKAQALEGREKTPSPGEIAREVSGFGVLRGARA